MSKSEFLIILRQALDKEVNPEAIEQNIRFYDQYIGNQPEEEERKLINELGDPRLIAKTIIETEKMSKHKDKFMGDQNDKDKYYNEEENMKRENQNNNPFGRNIFFTKLSWYHKIIIAIVILIILVLLVILGRILIFILFTFGFPLLIIGLLLMLFRKK